MMCILRMKGSYTKRDSWTRLSVTPAEIMQVILFMMLALDKKVTIYIIDLLARESPC